MYYPNCYRVMAWRVSVSRINGNNGLVSSRGQEIGIQDSGLFVLHQKLVLPGDAVSNRRKTGLMHDATARTLVSTSVFEIIKVAARKKKITTKEEENGALGQRLPS